MKLNTIIVLAAMAAGSCTAQAMTDTVRVINNADQVVITETDSKVQVDVKGMNGVAGKSYRYQAQYDKKGRMTTSQREGRDWSFRIPVAKSDTDACGKHNFEMFISGLYMSWGGTSAYGSHKDSPKLTREWGILNILGAAYKFGDRNRLSLGVGYQHRWYRLKSDFHFVPGGELGEVVDIAAVPAGHDKPCATLHNHTVQFPLLYAKGFGKGFWAYAGGVMDWNCYADYDYCYQVGNTKHKENTRGLHQRKITFDVLAGLTWHGLGFYFRYSPQQVFAAGAGPKLDKTWTAGVVVGF